MGVRPSRPLKVDKHIFHSRRYSLKTSSTAGAAAGAADGAAPTDADVGGGGGAPCPGTACPTRDVKAAQVATLLPQRLSRQQRFMCSGNTFYDRPDYLAGSHSGSSSFDLAVFRSGRPSLASFRQTDGSPKPPWLLVPDSDPWGSFRFRSQKLLLLSRSAAAVSLAIVRQADPLITTRDAATAYSGIDPGYLIPPQVHNRSLRTETH
ncbi:unnamed protein product [Phytophthora fragariaefolia]|uniref:Unnamed protein product n=1 Tax=Phytophthora fragariaefolia TaxID=1490495 RepID=A0A9W6XI62_9STRA|nr:unnamed protein product [Phytophthora fragariaefolia]